MSGYRLRYWEGEKWEQTVVHVVTQWFMEVIIPLLFCMSTPHTSQELALTWMRKSWDFEKNLVFKATPRHRKPTVCSYKKKKTTSNTQSHTEPSSFLLLSVHIAGKQPLNNLTPTFITAQQCSRLFFYITARSQSALNVALHKIGSIHLTRDACNKRQQ